MFLVSFEMRQSGILVPITLATLCAILTNSRYLLIQINNELPKSFDDMGIRINMTANLAHTRTLSEKSLKVLEDQRRRGKINFHLILDTLRSFFIV